MFRQPIIARLARRLFPRRLLSRDKVLFEDALKYLFEQEEAGKTISEKELGTALGIVEHQVSRFIEKLVELGFLEKTAARVRLTEAGRQEAVRIVRLHRLWEQYLAEETGWNPTAWHAKAHQLEHQASTTTADELAARLGFPRFDPHGDPIPTAAGEVLKPRGAPVLYAQPGEVVQVSHIEDDPPAAYQELLDHEMHPGTQLRVERKCDDGVTVLHQGETIQLSRQASANLWVTDVQEKPVAPFDEKPRTLADLSLGEEVIVRAISPACRGLARRRLLDLGFVSGTRVRAELRSLGGDPTAFRVRNTLVALRRDQAKYILVEKNNQSN